MATLSEITNAAGYVGNKELGGYGESAIIIDTRPIQQLAQYTFLYNRSQYEQRQKDADEKIKQLTKLTSYDLTTGIPKDKDELLDAQAKLIQYRAEEASKGTPKSPKEKMQREVDFLSKTAELIKKIDGAGARKEKLGLYKNEVQKLSTISAEEKELRIKQAEELFNNSDILTLPEIPNHDLTLPTIGEVVYDKVQRFEEDKSGNLIIGETIDEYSITGNEKASYLEANDLLFPTLAANATPQQKAEYEQKKLAFSKSKLGGWKDASQFLGGAFNDPNYKKTVTTNGINVIGEAATTSLTDEVDIEKIKASNPIAGGIIQIEEAYNDYILKKIERLERQDKEILLTGKKPIYRGGTDTPESLRRSLIDVTKPLPSEKLVALARFEKARPDKVEVKLTETDDAIQRGQMANQIKLEKMQQAGANYRATLEKKGDKVTTGETKNFMDLTGYTGTLTTADIAAIDPTLVESANGILKLTAAGEKAQFKILPNGDVEVNYNNGTPFRKALTSGGKDTPEVKGTIKVINKGKYQKESIGLTQTILKDRKDETQNPFTFTGLTPAAVEVDEYGVPIKKK